MIAVKRSIQARLQELEITSSATATIHSGRFIISGHITSLTSLPYTELQEAIDAYKSKTDEYLKRYEEAEINRAKAARAEAFGMSVAIHIRNRRSRECLVARRALADAEKAQAEAVADRQGTEQRLQGAEQRIQELERRLEEEGRETSDLALLRQRLAEEMDDERKQHQQDIAERDFAADQTRKKYQGRDHISSIDEYVH